MPGFIRRFSTPQPTSVLAAIEGIAIIDLPPPGTIQGITEGIACVVGEFVNLQYSCRVDSTGVVTAYPRAVQLFSAADMQDKVGGWDSTLGDFGGSDGNGFFALRNKSFTAICAIPVFLASTRACRVWRELCTNTSATDPTPSIPAAGGLAISGTEFKDGSQSRIRIGMDVVFTESQPFVVGDDGATTAVAATAATMTSAAGPFDFRTLGSNQISIAFNAGGTQSFNITKASATKAGSGYSGVSVTCTFGLRVGDSSQPTQSVTVTTASSVSDFVNQVNSQIFGARAVVNAGECDIVSDKQGSGASVTLSSVTNTLGTSGLSNGTATGTGTVADSGAVTAAELAAIMSGITNGSVSVVSGALKLTSTTTGASGTVTCLSASTADLILGGEFATNEVYTGSGTGNQATNTFTSAGSTFVTDEVEEGDAVVIGVVGEAGDQGDNAGTYRVVSVDSETALTLEKQDGSSFSFTTATDLVFRIHQASDADSGGQHQLSDTAGYTLPVRTLDASVAADTVCNPTVTQAGQTSTEDWQPLSGLQLGTHPSASISHDADTQGVNPANSSAMDALYDSALRALLLDTVPAKTVDIFWAARTSENIRDSLNNVIDLGSANGLGRVGCVAPPLTVTTTSVAGQDAYPGVGAVRNERLIYNWPNVQTLVTEAVGTPIDGADGRTHTDGILDSRSDGWLASVLSNLAPELNPGQGGQPVSSILAPMTGYARNTTDLEIGDWVYLKQRGICGPRFDPDEGAWAFQSGVTTSLTNGQKTINRRRFADFVQDSLAVALKPFAKQLVTQAWKDNIDEQVDSFLQGLLSPGNPSSQRIQGYRVDNKSGNTAATAAAGVYVLLVYVQMLITGDTIVLQTEVGTTVNVTPTNQ